MSHTSWACSKCDSLYNGELDENGEFTCASCATTNSVALSSQARHAPRSAGRKVLALAALAVVATVVLFFAYERPVGGVPATSEVEACSGFRAGQKMSTLDHCPSGASYAIACDPPFIDTPGFNELTCYCLRDGVQRTRFSAKTLPPLAKREDLLRVGADNCRSW